MSLELLKKVLASPRLSGFRDYQEFEQYCLHHLAVLPHEYNPLYEVLVKLQSLGHNARATLDDWQRNMTPTECAEFIRLLICVEEMEIDDFLKAA